MKGLEPAASAVTGRRNQLNYAPASLNQQQTGVSVRIVLIWIRVLFRHSRRTVCG